MGQCEVFVRKLGRSIDGTRSGAVSIDKVSTLNHKIFDLLLSAPRIGVQGSVPTTRWNLLPL